MGKEIKCECDVISYNILSCSVCAPFFRFVLFCFVFLGFQMLIKSVRDLRGAKHIFDGILTISRRSPTVFYPSLPSLQIRPFHNDALNFPILNNTFSHKSDKTAIVDWSGHFTFGELFKDSALLSRKLLKSALVWTTSNSILNEHGDLQEKCVAFLCPRDYCYVVTKYAIWSAGGVSVPLCTDHPTHEIEYYLKDCEAKVVVAHKEFYHVIEPLIAPLGLKVIPIDHEEIKSLRMNGETNSKAFMYGNEPRNALPESIKDRNAMVVYTSGTTGPPKGVVSTHRGIKSQITDMVKAWNWKDKDHIVHVLPLHHVHGIVNVLLTPLWSGAMCEMIAKFRPGDLWRVLLSGEHNSRSAPNVMMGVPTIYTILMDYFESHREEVEGYAEGRSVKEMLIKKCRLMVCGSAALPVSVMRNWEELSGHRLLERYGMSETGMILGNPYEGPRIPGTVGVPFDSVSVRLVDSDGNAICETDVGEEHSGELQVSGPSVFKEYLGKPEATAKEFVEANGTKWFKTGDIGCRIPIPEDKSKVYSYYYKILGRSSVDIIKSGGYKISALDVERHLLEHPDIAEVAVVGLKDDTYGESVAAVVGLRPGADGGLTVKQLHEWAGPLIARYKIPTTVKVVESIPRNAMGKINKKDLVKKCFPGV